VNVRGVRRAAGESGLTLIEVMITLLISLIVVGASADLFVQSNTSALANGRQVTLLSIAQSQIEKVRQAVSQNGFGALAMTSIPTKAGLDSDPSNPTDFITSDLLHWEVEENYQSPGTVLVTEPLVQSASGAVTPIQPNVTVGSTTATVYTFVTQVTDVCQGSTPGGLCTGATGGATGTTDTDVRRVIVAVQLNALGTRKDVGPNTPEYLSTVIANPVPSDQVNAANGLRLGVNVS